MKFLDPKIDTAFKRLFGSEDQKSVTIAFLNSILEYTGDRRIRTIDFLNTEQQPIAQDKKENILDILCIDEGGRQFIIEMQNAWELGFDKRMIWYGTKTYTSQLNEAMPYHHLKPVAVVAICKKFNVFPKNTDYKSIHYLINNKTKERDLEDLSYAFIELLKFKKQEHELKTDEEKWLFLLKEITFCDAIPNSLNQGEFKKACDALNRMSWTDNAYTVYQKMMIKAQSAEATANLLEKAEKGLKEAEKGLKEAAKSLQEAHEEERLKIAKAMLKKGLDLETIVSVTGLSSNQIKNLK